MLLLLYPTKANRPSTVVTIKTNFNQFKKMNRIFKPVSFALVLLSFVFMGCEDDPSIIGLDSSAKYGNIKITFDGTRPDGEPFTQTKNFRFLPTEGPNNFSRVETYLSGSQPYHYFYVRRLFDPFNGEVLTNYAELYLSTTEDEEGAQSVEGGDIDIDTYITTADKKMFGLTEYDLALNSTNITNVSYNDETGKLIVKFNMIVPAINNDTGADLTITGEIRVTVFEDININR
jgi:hypothetical protein